MASKPSSPKPSGESCRREVSEANIAKNPEARFATQMADGITGRRGPTVREHIEEIGIINARIEADRISDAACLYVLKHYFIDYWHEVARRHGIELKQHTVRNARVL